ncbi:MAG: iron-molybdenum cofactor biosynthesis protein [Bacteroidetes bacterium]|nr:iron-molybdenum cofactor biosynthesis protein [Bacteroidota bacterium]
MKIAVASDDGISLTGHVGRCEMFLVFDVDGNTIKNVEQRPNTFTMHKQGHHHEHDHHQGHEHGHHHSHEGIVSGLSDCRYLICSCAGPGLISDLAANGIMTLLTDETAAETAVLQYLEGTLPVDDNKACKGHNH